jgi:hypothetical protein
MIGIGPSDDLYRQYLAQTALPLGYWLDYRWRDLTGRIPTRDKVIIASRPDLQSSNRDGRHSRPFRRLKVQHLDPMPRPVYPAQFTRPGRTIPIHPSVLYSQYRTSG